MLDLLDRYDPDVIRFYLTTIMPETSDSEFREDELITANNGMLIATWGNLANRVISMIARNFEGIVPTSGPLAPESAALLDATRTAFATVAGDYNLCHFRNGLQECLKLAQAANRYLDERAPWKAVKTDLPHAAETLATTLNVINGLKTLLHPILPFSTQALHEDLSQVGTVATSGWAFASIPEGTRLRTPRALYRKLDVGTEVSA